MQRQEIQDVRNVQFHFSDTSTADPVQIIEVKGVEGDSKAVVVSQPLPSAPALLIIDPQQEGYDAKAHIEHLENLYAGAQRGMKQIEIIYQRQMALMRQEFKQKHPRFAKAEKAYQAVENYWDEIELAFRALMGGAIVDQIHKNDITKGFAILLEAYILFNLISTLGKSTWSSAVKYYGVKRMIKEELDRKHILSKHEFELLEKAPTAWLESLFNISAVGLIIAGGVYLPKPGGFLTSLYLIGTGVVSEVLGSFCNEFSKNRIAEEMLGKQFDTGHVPMSLTHRVADRGGKVLTGVGAILVLVETAMLLNNSSDRELSRRGMAGFFILMCGFLSMGSLTPRLRGSEMIDHVVEELQLGRRTDRLKSFFLNCRPSRSDLDDFVTAGFNTLVMSVVAYLIDQDDEIGYFAAAACGLAGYLLAKLQMHQFTLSKTHELSFWRSAPERKAIEQQQPAEHKAVAVQAQAPDQDERNGCVRSYGCLTRAMHRFYMFMTKKPESNCTKPNINLSQHRR